MNYSPSQMAIDKINSPLGDDNPEFLEYNQIK